MIPTKVTIYIYLVEFTKVVLAREQVIKLLKAACLLVLEEPFEGVTAGCIQVEQQW